MKYRYPILCLTFLLSAHIGFAQAPVIDSTMAFTPGYHFIKSWYNGGGANLGDSGANKVWDFSSVNHGAGEYHWIKKSNWNSNWIMDSNIHSTIWSYKNNPSGQGIVSHIAPGGSFDDYYNILFFPWNYQELKVQNFTGRSEIAATSVAYGHGTDSSIYDGYGTLKNPGGTYTNAVRIKSVIDITDSVFNYQPFPNAVFDTIRRYHYEIYAWYAPGIRHPLQILTYRTAYNPGSSSPFLKPRSVPWGAAFFTSAPTSMSERSKEQQLQLFPNPAPANGTLNLTVPENTQCAIVLYDVTGKVLKQWPTTAYKANHKTSLSLKGLSPGLYLLSVNGSNISYYQRVVIE